MRAELHGAEIKELLVVGRRAHSRLLLVVKVSVDGVVPLAIALDVLEEAAKPLGPT